MKANLEQARRVAGLTFLSLAILFLTLGLTLLDSHLKGISFLLFWFACFAFTFLALAMALWDLAAIRRQSLEDNQHLLHECFGDFEDTLKSINNSRDS